MAKAQQEKRLLKVKRPLAAYLRLSVDRDGNKVGYDVQQQHIERWAAYQGETIGRWYRDEDLTAADRKVERPEYEAMLADVEAGQWGGIVVWRLDRLVRLSFELERCLRIITDADAFMASLDPEIRTDGPMGPVFMRLMVIFAEMEISSMKARARGHRLLMAEGGAAHGGGPRKFGFVGAITTKENDKTKYHNVGEAGVVHDPREADLIREAARRIAFEGWSWTDVITDWNQRDEPIRGTTGKPFSVHSLQTILTSPRVAGLREYGVTDPETGEAIRLTSKAQWEAILDHRTWRTVCAQVGRRGKNGPRSSYLLSQIAVCGRCGQALGGRHRTKKGERIYAYYCKDGPEEKLRGRCGSLDVRMKPIDDLVREFVAARLSATPTLLQELIEEPDHADDQLAAAVSAVNEIAAQVKDLARLWAGKVLSTDAWVAANAELAERQEPAEALVKRLSRRSSVPLPKGSDLDNLAAWFDGLLLTQQRAVVERLIERLEILPGHYGPRFDPKRVLLTPRNPKKLN